MRDLVSQCRIRDNKDYRVARAAEYLRTTNAGMREIARLTGYDPELSISNAFPAPVRDLTRGLPKGERVGAQPELIRVRILFDGPSPGRDRRSVG